MEALSQATTFNVDKAEASPPVNISAEQLTAQERRSMSPIDEFSAAATEAFLNWGDIDTESKATSQSAPGAEERRIVFPNSTLLNLSHLPPGVKRVVLCGEPVRPRLTVTVPTGVQVESGAPSSTLKQVKVWFESGGKIDPDFQPVWGLSK